MQENNMLARAKRVALAFQRHDWEQGVMAQAFLEAGETETALAMAVASAQRQHKDGRCSQLGMTQSVTDPCSVGEALITACKETNDPALITAKDALLGWALSLAPRNSAGIVYHLCCAPEFWVDSMYMLPPFLAKAGYYAEAMLQLDGWWNALYLPERHLLAHRWDDGMKRFIRMDAWGVGNGWALAGMARVIDALPDDFHVEKQRLIEREHILLDAMLPLQRADGRFHDVLDDPTTFAEVNCGQMFAYTVYRGIRSGWLEERYLAAAEKSRAIAICSIDEFGIVRNVCGLPDFDHCGVAPEGQAFFILMETARNKLQ